MPCLYSCLYGHLDSISPPIQLLTACIEPGISGLGQSKTLNVPAREGFLTSGKNDLEKNFCPVIVTVWRGKQTSWSDARDDDEAPSTILGHNYMAMLRSAYGVEMDDTHDAVFQAALAAKC